MEKKVQAECSGNWERGAKKESDNCDWNCYKKKRHNDQVDRQGKQRQLTEVVDGQGGRKELGED